MRRLGCLALLLGPALLLAAVGGYMAMLLLGASPHAASAVADTLAQAGLFVMVMQLMIAGLVAAWRVARGQL